MNSFPDSLLIRRVYELGMTFLRIKGPFGDKPSLNYDSARSRS